MADEEVFSGWSEAQLRGYLAESGAVAPPPGAPRAALARAAAEAARRAEAQLVAARAPRAGGTPAWSGAAAGAPPPAWAAGAPPPQVPQAMPRPGGGRKRALFIGCNYAGTSSQLSGCVNDARCLHFLLQRRFAFPDDACLLMADDHYDPARRPTRANISAGIAWLTAGLRAGDSLFFSFSGHGAQVRDGSGLEADGLNETLLPLDHRSAGQIVDDELNARLVNPLPRGAKLHAVIDACHSGSVLDLPFTAALDPRGGGVRWESEYHHLDPRVAAMKGTAGGFCVQFGASRDHQTAADTRALSGGVATGACTYAFIAALERRGLDIAYGELLLEMHRTLGAAGLGAPGGAPAPDPLGGLFSGGLLGGLLGGGGGGFRGQSPVLSCAWAFDLASKFTL